MTNDFLGIQTRFSASKVRAGAVLFVFLGRNLFELDHAKIVRRRNHEKNQEEEIFDFPCDRPVHTVRGGPVLACGLGASNIKPACGAHECGSEQSDSIRRLSAVK